LVYMYDYQGNTNAVLDSNNALKASYRYSNYGSLFSADESLDNPFRYLGQHGIISDSSALYYVRARYYSPELDRWTQSDVKRGGEANPLSLNRYVLNEGDVVNFVDISGEDALAVVDTILSGTKDRIVDYIQVSVDVAVYGVTYATPRISAAGSVTSDRLNCTLSAVFDRYNCDNAQQNTFDDYVKGSIYTKIDNVYGKPIKKQLEEVHTIVNGVQTVISIKNIVKDIKNIKKIKNVYGTARKNIKTMTPAAKKYLSKVSKSVKRKLYKYMSKSNDGFTTFYKFNLNLTHKQYGILNILRDLNSVRSAFQYSLNIPVVNGSIDSLINPKTGKSNK